MPFLKKIGEKRLWIGILLVMAVTTAVDMLGAAIFCRGWLSPSYERMWMLLSWFLGAFFGCRYVLADGRKRAILWAGMTAGIPYIFIWIVRLAAFHNVSGAKDWWKILIAMTVGAVLSVLLRPSFKKRKKKKSNQKIKVKRR